MVVSRWGMGRPSLGGPWLCRIGARLPSESVSMIAAFPFASIERLLQGPSASRLSTYSLLIAVAPFPLFWATPPRRLQGGRPAHSSSNNINPPRLFAPWPCVRFNPCLAVVLLQRLRIVLFAVVIKGVMWGLKAFSGDFGALEWRIPGGFWLCRTLDE